MRPDAAAARGAQRLSSGGQRLTRRRSRDRHDPRRPSFPNSGLGTPLRETPVRAPRTSEVLRRQAPETEFLGRRSQTGVWEREETGVWEREERGEDKRTRRAGGGPPRNDESNGHIARTTTMVALSVAPRRLTRLTSRRAASSAEPAVSRSIIISRSLLGMWLDRPSEHTTTQSPRFILALYSPGSTSGWPPMACCNSFLRGWSSASSAVSVPSSTRRFTSVWSRVSCCTWPLCRWYTRLSPTW